MPRRNPADDFDDYEDAYENPADDFDDDFDDDDDDDFDDDFDDDDDARSNPDSALTSLMRLASEAMAKHKIKGSIDVDFYTSEAKIKEWVSSSDAVQINSGIWFSPPSAAFRYSKSRWGKEAAARRRESVSRAIGSIPTIQKLYAGSKKPPLRFSSKKEAQKAAQKAAKGSKRFAGDMLAEGIGKVRELLHKHEAPKHFMEGGTGFSAFIYAIFDVGGKQKQVLVGSAHCFEDTPAFKRDMKKIPGLISYYAVAD